MKKLIRGIVEYQKNLQPNSRQRFAQLALGQSPDALYIGCSDSRVAVNVFASTDPGDLFVVRNLGNLVPPCGVDGQSSSDESEAAAIEFALGTLNVSNIIICGHSECGAMRAIVDGRQRLKDKNLCSWLRHGEGQLGKLAATLELDPQMENHNRLSQLNVLRQLDHIKTYPIVRERIESGKLKLHSWWFEISQAEVFAYEESLKKFVLLDERAALKMIERLERDELR